MGVEDQFVVMLDERRIETIAREAGEALELAAVDVEPWHLALQLLNAEFPDAYFSLVNRDFLHDRTNCAVAWNLDPLLLESYSQHYAQINPYNRYWMSLRSGDILNSQKCMPIDEIRHSEFYNDWLCKAEARTEGIGLKVDASPVDTIYIPMHCSQNYFEEYAAACTAILARLRAPLERAVRTSRIVQQASNGMTARAALLDHDKGPALVIDHGMRITEANAAALCLLQEGMLVGSRDGRLLFRAKALSEKVARMVKDLASSPTSSRSRLGWDEDGAKWMLSLTRLPADSVQQLLAPRTQILLRLTNITARSAIDDLSEFARLFRLTPAETLLAAALGDGLSLVEAAACLHITFETARQRLKQIFRKTDIGKQSELCVMLARFNSS